MRVLLDTHTFIWGLSQESKLSERVRLLLPTADTWFSVASIWEMLTKVKLGKLSLPEPAGRYITSQLSSNGTQTLPVTLHHVLGLEALPFHHRDPFDRIIIAQSIREGWPIVTADPWFSKYPVKVIW